MGQERLGHQDGTHEVRLDAALDLIVGEAFDRAGDAVAGIVEHDVHRAVEDCLGHCGFDLGGVGHVQCQQLHAGDRGQLAAIVGSAHGGQHLPASGCKQFCSGLTQSR